MEVGAAGLRVIDEELLISEQFARRIKSGLVSG